MKLGTLLLASYLAILVLCFAYPVYLVADHLRIVYLESAEEPLVDTANVLAELLSVDVEVAPANAGDRVQPLDVDRLYPLFDRIAARPLHAKIYEIQKQQVDLDVYVTDAHGKVLFDSRGREFVGADYSQWRDVSRTLAGQYGARVSHMAGDRSLPYAMYVAAPIRIGGKIAGVLTVVKPTTSVKGFLGSVKPRLLWLAAVAASAAIVLALLLSLWVRQQVGRLTHYAEAVREGERVPFPKLVDTELRTMGLAFERMRESLAGHSYVEQYVRALTHEIKSPISAIAGAVEILETPSLDEAQRRRFLGNLRAETARIQDLVDRMLELSELEVRRALPQRSEVALAPICRTLLEAQAPNIATKELQVELHVADDVIVPGDSFLLHLALSNLVKNAVEFSPRGGALRIHCTREADQACVTVTDEGPGIPEYAHARIFERFYSLERPDTGRKSTGLGLNFVKEIAALHHGQVTIANAPSGGLRATLTLPLS